MEVNELRIGNHTHSGVVRGIYPQDARTETQIIFDTFMIGISKVDAIVLSDEWMIRLGFTKSSNFYYAKDFYAFDLEHGVLYYGGSVNESSIKCVHELQNLYYALTKIELK